MVREASVRRVNHGITRFMDRADTNHDAALISMAKYAVVRVPRTIVYRDSRHASAGLHEPQRKGQIGKN
jgi:hypothetical protein